MEVIVQFLMILICVVASLKLSHAPRWGSWVYAVAVGAFIILTGDWTSNQPKALMNSYIEDKDLREDIAILVTLESMLFISFTFLKLAGDSTSDDLRNKIRRATLQTLTFYPSLLVFPILLYAQSQLFVAMTGYDFGMLSWSLAIIMVLFFGLLPMGLRILLPEREMRLELLFLASLFVFIFGLITTADERMTYRAPEYNFPWQGLVLAVVLVITCGITGFFLPHIKRIIHKKK